MENLQQVHITHSRGIKNKLDSIDSINTNTLTNSFCVKMNAADNGDICEYCYSVSMLEGYRKTMVPALQRNSDLLSAAILTEWQLPRIMSAVFRFSGQGELLNDIHFENLCLIAEYNPHCTFALWTKRATIVNKALKKREKPSNLILVFSNSKIGHIMARPPTHFDKTFNNVKGDDKLELQNCTGQQCKNCLACYQHNDITTIIERKK
tara:strand:- start:686 stop:1309 length:624 start_codon:yes stop_codon:yes gene_type:complete